MRLILEGGWYATLRLPAELSDGNFAVDALVSKAVYIHPGHFYDFSTPNYAVLSLIGPEAQFGHGLKAGFGLP